MDPMREDAFDRILAHIDRSRRSNGATTCAVGPFTLYWDYARPTIGTTVVATSDVHDLLRRANEDPPWASIARNKLLVEWDELEWIAERHPELAGVVSDAGLAVRTNPVLIKYADAITKTASITPIGAQAEKVGANSDPRELLAAWRFADATGPAPLQSPEGVLDGIRRVAASLSEDGWRHGGDIMPTRAPARSSCGPQGRIVALGMHEPSAEVSEITSLAVLPPFRRRGFGTALAAALAADAFDRGKDLVYVESAPEAAELYVRAGFQLIGSIGRASL